MTPQLDDTQSRVRRLEVTWRGNRLLRGHRQVKGHRGRSAE